MTQDNLYSKGYRILKKEGIISFTEKFFRYTRRTAFRKFREIFSGIYYPSLEKWYLYTRKFDTDNWDAPLNPYKVVYVSPEEVEKMTGRYIHETINQRIARFGETKSGNWDITDETKYGSWRPEKYGETKWIFDLMISNDFEENIFFQSLKNHFEDEEDWKNTQFYNKMIEGIEEGKPGWPDWGRTEKEVISNLEHIDNLYKSIKQHGVKKQTEVDKAPFKDILNSTILVDISRDGEFLFVEGRRRLTIAKLLEINEVPVRIQLRHPEWMNYRDKVFKQNLDRDHPDFKEFQ